MGLFGLFDKKSKEMDIPPPPPPIISSEEVPMPMPKEPKIPDFMPPNMPAQQSPEKPAVSFDDFMPKERTPIFTNTLPDVPGFSQPVHLDFARELRSVSPDDFGSTVFEEDEPLEKLHHPEPIVPPSKPMEFKGLSQELKQVEDQQIGQPVKKKPIDQPLFVKAQDYKSLLGALTVIKTKVGDSEKILAELNELKNVKDKTFEKWRTELEDIQRKLLYIDKTLYEER